MRREDLPPILGPVGYGLLVSLVAVLVAAIVATLLLFIGLDWAPYLHFVGLSIAFASVALGGILAGARAGSRGWLVGLLSSACFVLVCFLLALIAGANGIVASLTLARLAIACALGMIGGVLGVGFSS